MEAAMSKVDISSFITSTELVKSFPECINKVNGTGKSYIMKNSKPIAVIMSIDEYSELIKNSLLPNSTQSNRNPEKTSSNVPDIQELINTELDYTCFNREQHETANNILSFVQHNHSKKEQIALAEKALIISPFCSYAYICLARYKPMSLLNKKAMYERAILTSIALNGIEELEDAKDLYYETEREYIIALSELAIVLWEIGDKKSKKQAIKYANFVISRNSQDNCGIRYHLINWYLSENSIPKAETLFNKFFKNDATPMCKYTDALLSFCKNNKDDADKKLEIAFRSNIYVPHYMLYKKLPEEKPLSYYSFGFEDEAITYVWESKFTWFSIKGAIEWFKSVYNKELYTYLDSNLIKKYEKSYNIKVNEMTVDKSIYNKPNGLWHFIASVDFDTYLDFKQHARDIRTFIYIENDKLLFSIQSSITNRLTCNITENPYIRGTVINDNIRQLSETGLIYLKLYTTEGTPEIIQFELFIEDRPRYILEKVGDGVRYMYQRGNDKYLTDLKDKFGREYPFSSQEEAEVHFIYNLICDRPKSKFEKSFIEFIKLKFDLDELRNYRYNRLVEVANYLHEKYNFHIGYNSYIVQTTK